jgi:hypothetical protein
MKKSDKIYWIIFGLFGGLFILASFVIFSKKIIDKNSGKIKGRTGNGFYRIEANTKPIAGSKFKVQFIANSDNKNVNAVGLIASFDPIRLQVANIDTAQSFCQFYPVNKFDNGAGKIHIECGAPNPGFKGENTIAVIEFVARIIGETKIRVGEDSQILLNDGKGTNIFSTPTEVSISILSNM